MQAFERELSAVEKNLKRGKNGELISTTNTSFGYQHGPASQMDFNRRITQRAEELKKLAEQERALGRSLEADILQNQSDFELAEMNSTSLSRRTTYGIADERREEHIRRQEESKREIQRLRDQAAQLDQELQLRIRGRDVAQGLEKSPINANNSKVDASTNLDSADLDKTQHSKVRLQDPMSQKTDAQITGLPKKHAAVAAAKRVEVKGFNCSRSEDGRSLEYRSAAGNDERVAFRDMGERVTIPAARKNDPELLRAALTVASSKFEKISLNGSEEFRQASVREAVAMGIEGQIANKELKAMIDHEKLRFQQSQSQGRNVDTQGIKADGRTTQVADSQRLDVKSQIKNNQQLPVKQVTSKEPVAIQAGTEALPVAQNKSSKIKADSVGSEALPVQQTNDKAVSKQAIVSRRT